MAAADNADKLKTCSGDVKLHVQKSEGAVFSVQVETVKDRINDSIHVLNIPVRARRRDDGVAGGGCVDATFPLLTALAGTLVAAFVCSTGGE